jgi:branched-chain amino acid transport system permease protein
MALLGLANRSVFKRALKFGPFLTLILLALPLVFKGNDYYLAIIFTLFLYGGACVAWNLLAGYGGQVSFGHAAFFGLGAYTSTLLYRHFGISPWIGIFGGGFVCCLLATIIGLLCFRLRGLFFALATLAFGLAIETAVINLPKLTNGSIGLYILFKPSVKNLMFESGVTYAYVALGYMLLTVLVTWLIERSKIGYQLVAVREDEEAAKMVGVNTTVVKLIAFNISAFFTSTAGVLFAQNHLFIDPTSVFSWLIVQKMLLYTLIGGMGTLWGPVVGTLLMTPLLETIRLTFGEAVGFYLLLYGLILIVVVIFVPYGIMGILTSKLKTHQV